MIFVVAPEPADWLGPTVEVASACGPVSVFAPWAIGVAPPDVVPERIRRAWERRRGETLASAHVRAGWLSAELALRAWARSRTDRLMTARFMRRQAADLLAARAVVEIFRAQSAPSRTKPPREAPTHSPREAPTRSPREAPADSSREAPTHSSREAPTHSPREAPTHSPREAPTHSPREAPTDSPREAPTDSPRAAPHGDADPAGLRVVIAPSLAARAAFASAPPGCLKILVEDLPSFRQLHADLDVAALAHPDCRFLRRYRAPARLVARQEAERVLADALLVRGRFAAEQHSGAGKPVLPLPLPRVALSRAPRAPGARWRVLLAGLATARNGSMEALQAAGDWELVVRPGEGMEPADLLSRPNVRAARPAEIATLDGIDLVIAPAWCESHSEELRRAAAARVPAIATRQAAGWLVVTEIPPGDAAALRAAAALARPPEPDAADPSAALRSLIRGESARRMLTTSLGG